MFLQHINFKDDFKYNVYLRKPNMEIICTIDNKFIKTLDLKFIDLPSIILEVPRYQVNENKKEILNPLYDAIKKGRLISVDNKHCFKIANFKEEDKGKKSAKKILTVHGRRKILEKRPLFLTGIERQIKKDETHTSDGVMDILKQETSWSMGHLDDLARYDNVGNIRVPKYRWFDAQDKNWRQFLSDDCTNAFKCLFLFDDFNKKINVYDESSIGTHNGLVLSDETFLKSVVKEVNYDKFVTRLIVEGKDGIQINSVNPLGTNYVENFDCVKNDMSEMLRADLDKYEKILKKAEEEWLVVRNEILEIEERKESCNQSIEQIKEKLIGVKGLQTAYIKCSDNDRLSLATREYENWQSRLCEKMSELQNLNSLIDCKNNLMKSITDKIRKETCTDNTGVKVFLEDELEELDEFIEVEKYSNTSHLTELGLYKDGLKELSERQKPTIEFSCNAIDFYNLLQYPKGWDKKVRLGDFITIRTKELGEHDVRLIGIKHQPNSKKLHLTFSNKPIEFKQLGGVGKVASSTKESKGILDRQKNVWNNYKIETDFVRKLRSDGLDLATAIVNGRSSFINKISIDEYGIMVADASDENRQLYIGSSLIALTDDKWFTCKTAIDCNGIMADQIVGRLLIGEKLYISDEKGVINISNGKIEISDPAGRVRCTLGEYEEGKYGLALWSKDGKKTILSEDGILQSFNTQVIDNVDIGHPLSVRYYVSETMKKIYEVKLAICLEDFKSYERDASSKPTPSVTITQPSQTIESNGCFSKNKEIKECEKAGEHTHTGRTNDKNDKFNHLSETISGGHYIYDLDTDKAGEHSHNIEHTHKVEIPQQTFQVNIGGFGGDTRGISESGTASDVTIKIDGKEIDKHTIKGDSVLDITQWINTSVGWHKIELFSKTLGRINATMFMQYFASI